MTKRRTGRTRSGSQQAAPGGEVASKERAARATMTSEPTDVAGERRQRVQDQVPIDRYRQRGQLSQRQYDAAIKLRHAWDRAGGTPNVTPSYQQRVDCQGSDAERVTEAQAAAHKQVQQAMAAVGNRLSGILVSVVLMDETAQEWATSEGEHPKGGIVGLRLALDTLADHCRL